MNVNFLQPSRVTNLTLAAIALTVDQRRSRSRRGRRVRCRSRPDRDRSTEAPFAATRWPGSSRSEGSRTPLHRPADCAGGRRTAAAVEGDPRRNPFRPELPAGPERVNPAGPSVRGLPVPQRLHADAAAQRRASGAGVDPRRRLLAGRRPQLRRLQARSATASSSSRSTTGSARSASSPTRRSPPSPGGPSGNYGLMDQQAALALGAAQHRALRRRPAKRHDRRPVGRRRVGARAPRLARLPRALPAGDRAERRVRAAPACRWPTPRRSASRSRRSVGCPDQTARCLRHAVGHRPRQRTSPAPRSRRGRRQGAHRVDRDGAAPRDDSPACRS